MQDVELDLEVCLQQAALSSRLDPAMLQQLLRLVGAEQVEAGSVSLSGDQVNGGGGRVGERGGDGGGGEGGAGCGGGEGEGADSVSLFGGQVNGGKKKNSFFLSQPILLSWELTSMGFSHAIRFTDTHSTYTYLRLCLLRRGKGHVHICRNGI